MQKTLKYIKAVGRITKESFRKKKIGAPFRDARIIRFALHAGSVTRRA
jgi:hypothetical protein